MILVLSGKRSQGLREDVVIGEISSLNSLANDKGQFLLIWSNNFQIHHRS